jgi:hypothetical protein
LPIELAPHEADPHLVRQAAIYKASGKLAYAEAFAAALARINNVELVTGGNNFKSIEGEIRIAWLK